MNDFLTPRRMGIRPFLVIFLRSFNSVFSTVFILVMIKFTESEFSFTDKTDLLQLFVGVGIVAAIALLMAVVIYFPKKFYIKDQNLIFRHGLFNRQTTFIPLDKVHSLRTKRGIFYMLFDVRGIIFDTLASKGAEIELILSEQEWKNLLERIDTHTPAESMTDDVPPPFHPSATKKFGNKELIKDALCQNHLNGLAVLSGLFVVVYDFIDDVTEDSGEAIADMALSRLDDFAVSPALILALAIAMYLTVMALWSGKILIRYYDLFLKYDGKLMTFDYGLLSRSTSRFAYDKICTIWVKHNILERRFGLCTLMLKQALNASAQNEEDNLRVYGADSSGLFLGWWLGPEYSSDGEIMSAKSGKGVIVHSAKTWLALSLVAAVILCYFHLSVYTLIPAACVLISLLRGVMAMRHSSIALRDNYIVISNGHFAQISNYLKYENIEVVRLRCTPFTRWTGRVSLSLSTSGSTFTVRSLKEGEAKSIQEIVINNAEFRI